MRTNKPSTDADASELAVAVAISRPGRILVETEALFLVGLVVFVALATLTERLAGLEYPLELGPIGSIAFAAAPALLWLGYFYRQDRREPEPKHFVFGVFLLGALVAGPIASFLIEQATDISALRPPKLNPLSIESVVKTMLVIAVSQELLKYTVVRYTVYTSREFDEPLDGIVYASAAGIGFATYENTLFLSGSSGEVLLGPGAATIVVSTLAHACFAGVIGYALSRAKFVSRSHFRRTLTLLTGLLVAIGLNGGFHLLATASKARGFVREPWREVAFSAGFVIVVFFVVSMLARQLMAVTTPPSGSPREDD